MKRNVFNLIGQYFRLWFLPQPAHDDLFPENEQPAGIDEPAENSKAFTVTHPSLESAQEMEQRAAREITREHLNIHEEDLSGLTRPPESAEDRASRTSNPFSRSSE